MPVTEFSERRIVFKEEKTFGLALAFAALPCLMFLGFLGSALTVTSGEQPLYSFHCDRAANRCELTVEGEAKKYSWALDHITKATMGAGRGGSHLGLLLKDKSYPHISDNADGAGSGAEYVRAEGEINAFLKSSEPSLTTTYRWRPNSHTVWGRGIPAAVFLFITLLILSLTSSNEFVFDKDEGIRITRRRLFFPTRRQSLPLTEVVEIVDRHLTSEAKANTIFTYAVDLTLRDGSTVALSRDNFRSKGSVSDIEKDLAALLGVPVRQVKMN